MKIVLFGSNGQVGWELQRALAPLGDLIALDTDASHNPGGLCGDFTDPQGLVQTLNAIRPHAIVNAAAHTAVDKAESEPELARAINALAPAALAQTATKLGAILVHYSTDYVFDGSGTQPWREDDHTGPLSVYGRTKLEGERAVASTPLHLVLRTSWVYAARGANFAKTMLRLAAERDSLHVIDDQIGAPTSAELLADVTAHALRALVQQPQLAGLYHCTAAGETNWAAYARFVLTQAQRQGLPLQAGPQQVQGIPSSSYPTAAQRPLNSRLDCHKLQQTFGLSLPYWQHGVARMLTEIGQK